MRTVLRDLRYGMRVLRGNPGFALTAVLTLALAIGANTTVFSWIDGVLLHPLPGVTGGDRIAVLETIAPNGEFMPGSYADYDDYRQNLKTVSDIAMSWPIALSIGEGESAQRTWGELVSGNYFAVLGVTPALGRVFLPEEYAVKPGALPLAVISHHLWQTRFRGDPGILGRTVRVNRQQLTVIGVAPERFRGTTPGLAYEMWVPLAMRSELNGPGADFARDNRYLWAFARLKPGVTLEASRAEAASFARRLAALYPKTNEGLGATLFPVAESHITGAHSLLREPLQILQAVCILVLLIACGNVANLLLARSVARQREFGIRMALGAAPSRIARQLLTEALLLAVIGAAASLPLVVWIGPALAWLMPPVSLPVAADYELNVEVLAFTVLICAAAALLSALVPALHSTRSDFNESLKEGGRSEIAGTRSHRLRGLLVVSEVALALVALIGAGLFTKSFQTAATTHPGFDPGNVLVANFYLAHNGYSLDQQKQFTGTLLDRLKATPGIVEVSYSDSLPLGFGSGPWRDIEVEGYAPGAAGALGVSRSVVSPGYFSLMRIPLVAGRDFTDGDDEAGAPVLIVNESLARRFFGSGSPLGRRVRVWNQWHTIVGLAKDSKYRTMAEAPRPFFYAPLRQQATASMGIFLCVRTAGDPDASRATVQREVAAVDPNVHLFDFMPLTRYIGESLYPQKVAAILLAALGAISIVLAAVGLYSVMAYAVSQRTHEIGIRMALGAQVEEVLGMVVRKGLILTTTGLLAGLAAALAGSRLVRGMLINVSPADPAVFAAAAVFLGLVALAASLLPARRAAKVDPMVALRHQ